MAKDRIKEAAGALTRSDNLRAAGQADQAVGEAKQVVDKAKQSVKKLRD